MISEGTRLGPYEIESRPRIVIVIVIGKHWSSELLEKLPARRD